MHCRQGLSLSLYAVKPYKNNAAANSAPDHAVHRAPITGILAGRASSVKTNDFPCSCRFVDRFDHTYDHCLLFRKDERIAVGLNRMSGSPLV